MESNKKTEESEAESSTENGETGSWICPSKNGEWGTGAELGDWEVVISRWVNPSISGFLRDRASVETVLLAGRPQVLLDR